MGKNYKKLYEEERKSKLNVADHNTRLLAEVSKLKKQESSQTLGAKIIGAGVGILGVWLPVNDPEGFGFLLVHFQSEKVTTDIPVYSVLGIIIIFWPQISDIFMKILKRFKK